MNKQSHIMKRIFISAIKWPILFLIISLAFTVISYTDDFFGLEGWENIFDFADKIASFLILFAVMTFIYRYAALLCAYYEKHLKENHPAFSLVLASIRKSLLFIFILATLHIILSFTPPTRLYLNLANNMLNMIIIMTVAWVALQILATTETVMHQRMTRATTDLDQHIRIKDAYTKVHVIRNIMTVIIIVLAAAAILMNFESVKHIGISLLASAGVLTAIFGLAAQRTLASIFAGLKIVFSQTLKIGDIVTIDNISGMIEEITFTFVTLKMDDKRRLIIPINQFMEKQFENWSREKDGLGISMHIFVDYQLPIEVVRNKLTEILQSSNYWDGKVNKLKVANLTDRAVDLQIQISARDPGSLGELRSDVLEGLLTFIRDHYPQCLPTMRVTAQPV